MTQYRGNGKKNGGNTKIRHMPVVNLEIVGAADVGLIFKILKPERRHLQQC